MVFQVVPFLWNSDAVEGAPAGSMYVPHILPTDFIADFATFRLGTVGTLVFLVTIYVLLQYIDIWRALCYCE